MPATQHTSGRHTAAARKACSPLPPAACQVQRPDARLDQSPLPIADEVPLPEFYRPAEVNYLRGCHDKAKAKLGWEPKHSFEDLVTLMVENDINENL